MDALFVGIIPPYFATTLRYEEKRQQRKDSNHNFTLKKS
jgi:hypothetical protein